MQMGLGLLSDGHWMFCSVLFCSVLAGMVYGLIVLFCLVLFCLVLSCFVLPCLDWTEPASVGMHALGMRGGIEDEELGLAHEVRRDGRRRRKGGEADVEWIASKCRMSV